MRGKTDWPGTVAVVDARASVLNPSDPTSVPTHEDAALALVSLRQVDVRDGLIALLTPGTLPVDDLPTDTQELLG